MAGWILFITIVNELIDRYMDECFCNKKWMDGLMAGWILFITIANELIDRYMEELFMSNNGWIDRWLA